MNVSHDAAERSVRVVPIMVMPGEFEGVSAHVLKVNGCTSNVISRDFAEANRAQFTFQPILVDVSHSMQGSGDIATEMIVNGTVTIGYYAYRGNWIVADARYDALLGMPWHFDANPKTNNESLTVEIDRHTLGGKLTAQQGFCVVQNMRVKQCQRSLKRVKKGTQIFRVVQISSSELFHNPINPKAELLDEADEELQAILKEHENVLESELPPGLPLVREVDHAIETKPGAEPPHRPLYQLSPAELGAARKYVDKLLASGKIRPSRSPYGAPLFFVKEPCRDLRGVVDYRALNRIAKRNNVPMPRCDEMFDRLGQAE